MNLFEKLHIKLDLKRHPNSIFFFKEDKFLMFYNWKSGYLGCRGEGFWQVLEEGNNWSYGEVQAFIRK